MTLLFQKQKKKKEHEKMHIKIMITVQTLQQPIYLNPNQI